MPLTRPVGLVASILLLACLLACGRTPPTTAPSPPPGFPPGFPFAPPSPKEETPIPVHDIANGPVVVGDVRITLLEVDVRQVAVQDLRGERQTKEQHLVVKISVENTSATHKIEYSSPAHGGSIFEPWIGLTDEHGNRYPAVDMVFDRIVGNTSVASIYPGKSITDLLVYEKPVDTAKTLTLRISKQCYKGDEDLKVTFPVRFPAR